MRALVFVCMVVFFLGFIAGAVWQGWEEFTYDPDDE